MNPQKLHRDFPRFLNVDLDLVTQKKPSQIIRDFGKDAVVLASDKTAEGHFTRFEIAMRSDTAEKVLSGYQRLLRRLSPRGVAEWSNAKKKEFNFGYDALPDSPRCEITIKQDWLRFIMKHDATLGVTIYPKEKDDAKENQSSEPAGPSKP